MSGPNSRRTDVTYDYVRPPGEHKLDLAGLQRASSRQEAPPLKIGPFENLLLAPTRLLRAGQVKRQFGVHLLQEFEPLGGRHGFGDRFH